MKIRVAPLVRLLPLVVVASACTSSPTAPTVTAPVPLLPANSAQIANASQPVTLVVTNALITEGATLPYTFDVATDAAFANKVFTNSSVAQGANGQTSVQPGILSSGAYYWHARAGTTGVFSTAFTFNISPAVVIRAPTPVAPLTGSTTNGWPTFTVIDAVHSGPVGPLVYRFDVSTSAAFTTVALTGTVAESPGQTNFNPPASTPAPAQTALFWRATAIDAVNVASSPPSAVQSFTYSAIRSAAAKLAAQEGAVLWPGTQPPGTNGHAILGNNWAVQTLISFNHVTFTSPQLQQLQVFDLIDRGMNPQSAINWMNSNGYATAAAYYACPNGDCSQPVIGFAFSYLALINGAWNMVIKSGA